MGQHQSYIETPVELVTLGRFVVYGTFMSEQQEHDCFLMRFSALATTGLRVGLPESRSECIDGGRAAWEDGAADQSRRRL